MKLAEKANRVKMQHAIKVNVKSKVTFKVKDLQLELMFSDCLFLYFDNAFDHKSDFKLR